MNLNLNNESTNIRRTQQKRYGSLLIDTTLREDKGSIDLTMPINRIQNNSGLSPAESTSKGGTNATRAAKIGEPSPKISPAGPQGSNVNSSVNSVKKIKDLSIKNSINTNSATKLMRGQKASISSKSQNQSKLLIALDWDINYRGNEEFELDTSLFLVDENNKTSEENFIFYGNPTNKNGSIVIDKDFNSGIKRAYDQAIELNLNLMPQNIQKFAVTVTVYEGDKRNQSFGQVSQGYFRIIDIETRSELFNYKFNEGLNRETAIVVAEIYRYKNEWKINPIGNGFIGGLKALCDNYGIETD